MTLTLEQLTEKVLTLEEEKEALKKALDMLSLEVRGGVDNPIRAVELKLIARKGPEALKQLAREETARERRGKIGVSPQRKKRRFHAETQRTQRKGSQ